MRPTSIFDTWVLFLETAESGSIRKAAEKFGLEPSTAKRRMDRLEENLGYRLFQRNARGISLTPQGADLYAQVLKLVQGLELPSPSYEKEAPPEKILEVVSDPRIPISAVTHCCASLGRKHSGWRFRIRKGKEQADKGLKTPYVRVYLTESPDADAFPVARILCASARMVQNFPPILRTRDLDRLPLIGIAGEDFKIFETSGSASLSFTPNFLVEDEDHSFQAIEEGMGAGIVTGTERFERAKAEGVLTRILPSSFPEPLYLRVESTEKELKGFFLLRLQQELK